jgi:hypothetical protein
MRYVVAGSSGFLGTALREALAHAGHEVVRLSRGTSLSAYDSQWDPQAGQVDLDVIGSADVVVNLAGAQMIRPWTTARRQLIRSSRVDTTATLAQAIAATDRKPVFLCQSGTDAYGTDRGDTVLSEETPPPAADSGFLHQVVRDWEAATEPAREAGARVCLLRTGAALSRRGGALHVMLPPFRLGLGGRAGSGQQYFPALSLADWVRAVLFLGGHESASGPFNLTGPVPVTNAEFTQALGRALHRPTRMVLPEPVLRRLFGELSSMLLGSHRAVPRALEAAGFEFHHRTVDDIVAAALKS